MIRADVKLSGFGQFDPLQVERRISTILWSYSDLVGTGFKDQIRASVFDWPGETLRRNGQRVTTPRNIVDSGNFLRSQVRRRESPTAIRFTWGQQYGVTYAGYILQGIPERNYPPRDWITPVLQRNPLDRYFSQQWSALGSLIS